MKIVSKFKDYYDSMRSMDREPEPLYVRETTTHRLTGYQWRGRRHGETPEGRATREAADPLWTEATTPPHPRRATGGRGVVAFCGRLYPFLTYGGRVAWTIQAFIDAAIATADDDDFPDKRGWLERVANGQRLHEFNGRSWDHFMWSRTRVVDDAPFRHFDAPVIAMTDEDIVVNPRLHAYDFARQVDSYTAWQDISMFLGNNLVRSVMKPEPVSDELKAHAHGFDKQSFRKTKTGRKKSDRGDW